MHPEQGGRPEYSTSQETILTGEHSLRQAISHFGIEPLAVAHLLLSRVKRSTEVSGDLASAQILTEMIEACLDEKFNWEQHSQKSVLDEPLEDIFPGAVDTHIQQFIRFSVPKQLGNRNVYLFPNRKSLQDDYQNLFAVVRAPQSNGHTPDQEVPNVWADEESEIPHEPLWSFAGMSTGGRGRVEIDNEPPEFSEGNSSSAQNKLSQAIENGDLVAAWLAETATMPLLSRVQEVQLSLLMIKGEMAAELLGEDFITAKVAGELNLDEVNLEEEVEDVTWLMNLIAEAKEDDGYLWLEEDGVTYHQKFDEAYLRSLIYDTELGDLRATLELGRRARSHMICANGRLVFSVAKKIRGGLEFVERLQNGVIGLQKGIDKYDVTQGNMIATYATWWIRQTITRANADSSNLVRVPVHAYDRAFQIDKYRERVYQDEGEYPDAVEIALYFRERYLPQHGEEIVQAFAQGAPLSQAAQKELASATKKIRDLLARTRQPLSLDYPLNDEADGDEFGDVIPDQNSPEPLTKVINTDLSARVEEVLSQLKPREANILRLRFGFYDGKAYTLDEVGERMGLSRERIRQIENKALHRLRHPRRARRLKPFLEIE